jgi:hypothetical protein
MCITGDPASELVYVRSTNIPGRLRFSLYPLVITQMDNSNFFAIFNADEDPISPTYFATPHPSAGAFDVIIPHRRLPLVAGMTDEYVCVLNYRTGQVFHQIIPTCLTIAFEEDNLLVISNDSRLMAHSWKINFSTWEFTNICSNLDLQVPLAPNQFADYEGYYRWDANHSIVIVDITSCKTLVAVSLNLQTGVPSLRWSAAVDAVPQFPDSNYHEREFICTISPTVAVTQARTVCYDLWTGEVHRQGRTALPAKEFTEFLHMSRIVLGISFREPRIETTPEHWEARYTHDPARVIVGTEIKKPFPCMLWKVLNTTSRVVAQTVAGSKQAIMVFKWR